MERMVNVLGSSWRCGEVGGEYGAGGGVGRLVEVCGCWWESMELMEV